MSTPALPTLAHALGYLEGAVRFADPTRRHILALATVAEAWRAYRRDMGTGDTGPAHAASADDDAVLLTHDPRRDAVLLWLADHGVPAIAVAAARLATMVDARKRFATDALALLDAARDALATAPATGALVRNLGLCVRTDTPASRMLVPAVSAIDMLVDDPGFAESHGHDAMLALRGGSLHHYVAAAPAGCWALNLALLGQSATVLPILAGSIPRVAFRSDLPVEERATALVDHWNRTARDGVDRLLRIDRRCAHGTEALASLSRNARARDAWGLVVALGTVRRTHLVRALGLSRAGGDLQAHALAEAGLVILKAGGRVRPTRYRPGRTEPTSIDLQPLDLATADLDASMAEIDRLLERSSQA